MSRRRRDPAASLTLRRRCARANLQDAIKGRRSGLGTTADGLRQARWPIAMPSTERRRSTCCAARSRSARLLGDDFVEALIMVKETELEAYQRVISSWEREHLLLNV